jgi:hypothetical protein
LPSVVIGRAMTVADQVRTSDTDQGTPWPMWKRLEEERRRLGPPMTDAEMDEFKALIHQL